jgi:20S proteasome subunit alpha 7
VQHTPYGALLMLSVSSAAAAAVACCSFYGESIPGNVLCERVASYKHAFNLYWSMR